LSFKVARTYVRKLKLKLRRDWVQYCKSGNKPKNIPSEPNLIYKENGFVSFQDWLGSDYTSNFNKEFLPFNESRNYIRTLNIKSETEWRKFVKSPKKPSNIPSAPPHSYKNQGWNGWSDFLGKTSETGKENKYEK
jgi:hypothetical protein